jgi:hypothetical protein
VLLFNKRHHKIGVAGDKTRWRWFFR